MNARVPIPRVEAVNDFGQLQEVRLRTDPQAFLQHLVARTRVYHFEVTRPSLQDIFVRIANPGLEGQDLVGAQAS